MPKVFISYRRDDTLAFTGRLRDKLAERFGPDQVFMDFDNIPLGSDFREHLQDSLKECDVLLAVIGPNWTGTVADANKSRLSDPADFVRLEIQVALERDIPIIPVLVGDASMPTEEELPPDLEPLLYRQAAPVDMARDFHVHADRLVNGIEQITEPRRTRFEERDSTVKEIQLLKSLRGALLIDEGSTAITLCAWTTVGIVTGLLSSIFFQGADFDADLEFVVSLGPGFFFAGALLLMGRYGTDPSLAKNRNFSPIVVAGCIAGWVAAWRLGAEFATVHPSPFWLDIVGDALCGMLGMIFVAASLLWSWDLGVTKWKATIGLILLGGVGGIVVVVFKIADATSWHQSIGVWFIFVPWQTTVLAGLAASLKLISSKQSNRYQVDSASPH